MRFSEEKLKQYAAPLSDTEEQLCLNAISMVRDSLKQLGFTSKDSTVKKLYEDTYAYVVRMNKNSREIKIFIQGSYANNTNIRSQSDVDIAIVQEDVFVPQYRQGISGVNYGFTKATETTRAFKDEIENCLRNTFGKDVERKNKSIRINGNSYRKDADTVPCRRLRDYRLDFKIDEENYIGGIVIDTDEGQRIINYPEQHIVNGRKKNADTNTYFKKMVRIIKNIRCLMEELGYSSSKAISSFGVESLLWNVPNPEFLRYKPVYRFIFGDIVEYLYSHRDSLVGYKEVNGIKTLCLSDADVEKYDRFIRELYTFYEYDI